MKFDISTFFKNLPRNPSFIQICQETQVSFKSAKKPKFRSNLPRNPSFIQICQETQVSFKSAKEPKFHSNLTGITGTLREDRCTFLIISRSFLLRMRNVSDRNCRENQNTRFMFNKIFFRKSCRLSNNVEKYYRAGQATVGNMAHARCMLDTKGYKHALIICNTYCFSTAIMVARTLLNVMLYVRCLSSFK
jgi:hypothetical protein